MRKLFMLLVAFLFFTAGFVIEGGNMAMLIAPTALLPIILCSFFTTMFAHNFSEIKSTFKEAYSTTANGTHPQQFQHYLLIIKSLQQSIIFWSLSSFVVALIHVFHIANPDAMHHALAVAVLALFYGFSIPALFLIPMEQNIRRKLLVLENI